MRVLIVGRDLVFIFLLSVVLKSVVVKGWHATEYHVEKPTQRGRCYIHQFGMYLKAGHTIRIIEHKNQKFCQKTTCLRGSHNELKLLHAGCPFVLPKSNCNVVKGNKHLPYPLCCAHLECTQKEKKKLHSSDYDYDYY